MNFRNHLLTKRQTAVQSCLRVAFYIFLAVGLLAVGYAGYIIADAQTYQTIQLRKFAHDIPIAEPHFPRIGERVGEIEIPRLALRALILQGESPQVLRRGIGHLPYTPMPGELGNVGLAGHRDSFFRPLRQIRPGDTISLRTLQGEFQYRVESTRIVSPANVEVLAATNRRSLTLVTCFPFNYVGAAPRRFIVRALQVPTSEHLEQGNWRTSQSVNPHAQGVGFESFGSESLNQKSPSKEELK
jgi:sortase A